MNKPFMGWRERACKLLIRRPYQQKHQERGSGQTSVEHSTEPYPPWLDTIGDIAYGAFVGFFGGFLIIILVGGVQSAEAAKAMIIVLTILGMILGPIIGSIIRGR